MLDRAPSSAFVLFCSCLFAIACSKPEPTPEPAAETATLTAPEPAPEPPPPAPVGPVLEAPADPNEACAQIVAVSYKGAEHAPATVTRDKAAAQARADELLKDARAKLDFTSLAKSDSDAPSSAPRGGVIGTYTKDTWPELHGALKEPLFALQVNETAAQVIDAPYGFVLLHRCKVDKRHSRHVLIRYKDAKNADKKIRRSADDARKLAVEVQQKLSQGAPFEDIVKKYSEDSSKDRGGDIGAAGRGRLAPNYEDTLWALKVGELSTVVETDFGFHVIQRLPDAIPPVVNAPAAPAK
jgi:PPIC-type PPIASE domain